MSFERTQIVIPSSFFSGTQPISMAVTSAAISSSSAIRTKYGDSTSFETHDAVTFHVLFFMFLSSQVTCWGLLGSVSRESRVAGKHQARALGDLMLAVAHIADVACSFNEVGYGPRVELAYGTGRSGF